MGKWITHEQAESERTESGRESKAHELERLEKRERLLKITLLEQRIRQATAGATNSEQRTESEREKIIAGALADHDTALLERAHNAIANFFILGSGAVFGSCIAGIFAFVVLLALAILASIFR